MSPVRRHFWQVVARLKLGSPRPMNSRLNWFMPAGVNSTVGSLGTSTSLGRPDAALGGEEIEERFAKLVGFHGRFKPAIVSLMNGVEDSGGGGHFRGISAYRTRPPSGRRAARAALSVLTRPGSPVSSRRIRGTDGHRADIGFEDDRALPSRRRPGRSRGGRGSAARPRGRSRPSLEAGGGRGRALVDVGRRPRRRRHVHVEATSKSRSA